MISFFTQDIKFRLSNKRRYIIWLKELSFIYKKMIGTVNIIFCSDSYLLEINRNFLRHDYCTDVVTFDYSYLCTKSKIAGDIFISIDTVRINAIEYGVTFNEELLRVMAHGLLHLLGYNDLVEEERLLMQKHEDFALKLYLKNYNEYV